MHDDNVEEVCSSCVATTVVNIQYCAVLAIAQGAILYNRPDYLLFFD